ncbi:hypothetical protein A2Z33_00180 [Candidatus Gottesmanbacteria bacterium RBG_16_52_11]|uniref:Uncharacterized protein n=1 Tax=Candidatus Gottesmanbacteria bacterium RBG_16_52_11 TaxID=1798374 RepID=A0A1F5YNX3_9BACT|nr:MAG: hypothetical protein A2Z33_00180 [Candidatus Gottesmanbacteria bacterium RBG_16_52_11]
MSVTRVFAGPVSPNYELKSYGFGAGGVIDATSSAYGMLGIIGEQSGDPATSATYGANPGLVFTKQANVPPAPTFTNPGSTYNRLKLILNTGGNPTDAEYAVAISDDNWATTRYVQSDFTPGTALGDEDWLSYTGWGGLGGKYITSLTAATGYQVMVKARHGQFSESAWGPEASAATVSPTLTFALSGDSITFDELTGANAWTDSAKSTTLTTSTNAYNGYTVYGRETGTLTDSYGNHISDFGSPNSAPSVWAGMGFGYTTNDSALSGGTADRFTSGGPKYAGFTVAVPGDPVADHTVPVADTPITNEQFTVSYRVTADADTSAGKYTNTIIYIVVPEY